MLGDAPILAERLYEFLDMEKINWLYEREFGLRLALVLHVRIGLVRIQGTLALIDGGATFHALCECVCANFGLKLF